MLPGIDSKPDPDDQLAGRRGRGVRAGHPVWRPRHGDADASSARCRVARAVRTGWLLRGERIWLPARCEVAVVGARRRWGTRARIRMTVAGRQSSAALWHNGDLR